MLCRSLEPSAGGHLLFIQGAELRPREEKEQVTPASALILDMMCLDPGTPGLGRSPPPWLQAVVDSGTSTLCHQHLAESLACGN